MIERTIERSGVVQIPKGVGIDGFLATIRKILRLPRVQRLSVDTRGQVNFVRVCREDEVLQPVTVEFDEMMPSAVIRGSELQELPADPSPMTSVCRLFLAASEDRMYPVAFVSGPTTTFWQWHALHRVEIRRRDEAYGVEFIYDDQIPAYALILCTAYTPGSSMVDVRKCYKMTMPEEHRLQEVPSGQAR